MTTPRANGVGRAVVSEPMDERTVEVYFDRLTDDELRELHEYLRRFNPPPTARPQ